jgi:hypothetical protein
MHLDNYRSFFSPAHAQLDSLNKYIVVPDTIFFIADHTAMYVATPPNEPHQCILTHFNNCNFIKAQLVRSLMMVFYSETCRSFLI